MRDTPTLSLLIPVVAPIIYPDGLLWKQVLGTPSGVIFIPPQLASEVVDTAQDVSLRDRFGKQRLREGVYTPGQIDRAWTEEMERDFEKWRAEGGREAFGEALMLLSFVKRVVGRVGGSDKGRARRSA